MKSLTKEQVAEMARMADVIGKIAEQGREAFKVFEKDYDEYIAEHDGDEPNWDSPVIFWDGEKAGWFWGGDPEASGKHYQHARFSMNETDEEIFLILKEWEMTQPDEEA